LSEIILESTICANHSASAFSRARPRCATLAPYRIDPSAPTGGSGASGGPANVAKVTMPQLGESVAEGTIGKWLKRPGDHVDKYEPLVEVITDKVNAEVPSPFEGVLREILAEEGATVPNNAEIAVIETADEANGTAAAAQAPTAGAAEAPKTEAPKTEAPTTEAPAPPPGAGPAGSDERGPREMAAATAGAPAATAQASAAPSAAATAPAIGDPDARMTPAVRRLLREHELTAAQIVGTGGGGRITREDVLKVVEAIRRGEPAPAAATAGAPATTPGQAAIGIAPVAPAAPRTPPPSPTPAAGTPVVFPDGADEVLLPMTRMRQGIAAQMTRALAVPHAYVHMEADASGLVRAREKAKRDYQAREGISLSYVPFVIKAAVEALRAFPTFNAHWTDQGLLAKRHIHMGVAVAVDDGLLVPVVRDVDQLSIAGLNRAIAEVAERARAGKLRLEDYGGSTFTIDNTGWFGSNLTMPIINVPEVAILTMEAITKRPVVRETPEGDVIAIRPIMNMVLAIDHRANDGAGAAAFLRRIKAWLEGVGPETPVY
jgi:pyruvate/2-oxoglutarate dehydrogenase complex dihydrolipoamide acyltransferase (E2) component